MARGEDTRMLGQLLTVLFFALVFIPFWNQHALEVNLLGLISLPVIVIWNQNKTKLSKKFIGALVVVCLVYIFGRYGTLRGLAPGLSLLILMAILKGIELNHKRDYLLFFLINLLLLAGHLLTVDSLLMAVYIASLSFFMLILIHGLDEEGKFSWPEKERMKIIWKISLFSLPQALILFFAFPRVTVGNFLYPDQANQSKTGFVTRLDPGEFAKTAVDLEPVFRAKFSYGQRPPGKDLYWRGAILGETDGFRWEMGKMPRSSRLVSEHKPVYEYEIDFSTLEKGRLFTLENTYQVRMLSRARQYPLSGETYGVFPLSHSMLRYRGKSSRKFRVELTKQEIKKYLQLPEEGLERMRKFATDFKNQRGLEGMALINALMSFFNNENFVYTLEPGSYRNVDQFFFERRFGFCEHYASVTAILARIWGIPARIVTGFQGGIYNPFGQYFTISGQDAHAWVEVYDEKKGWHRVDPVEFIAPDRIRLGAGDFFLGLEREQGEDLGLFLNRTRGSFWRRLTFAVDMVYFQVNQQFTSFDFENQKAFFKELGLEKVNAVILFFLCLGLLTLFALGLSFWLRALKRTKDPWRRSFQQFQKSLKESDRIGPTESLVEYGIKMKDRYPEAFTHLHPALDGYQRYLFSEQAKEQDLSNFRRHLRDFSKNYREVDNIQT